MTLIGAMGNKIVEFGQLIVELARSFTFKDVIDVAIVTLLIYSAIKLVRETRAGQLVKGLLLFIAIFLASKVWELDMLNNILTYFFQFAFLAILIVFQPELRKALEQMGRSNVGKSLVNVVVKDREMTATQTRRVVNSTVDAVSLLQQLKMGALIVFERQTKLGEVAETGTMLDARPSAQLIANIFFNKAPLHDGAMVIRGGRLLCAGCILPLTKNDSISSALGTRHRAALGLSEESDAIVLVVSEETGQISLAVNGVLSRDFSRDTLREKLDGYLLAAEEGPSHNASKHNLFSRRKGGKA